MQTAANVAKIALERCEELVENEEDSRNIKTLIDAAKGALETYRKARNLDDAPQAPSADVGSGIKIEFLPPRSYVEQPE